MSAQTQASFEERDAASSGDDSRFARRARLFDMLTAFFALVGLADAVYLTSEHLAGRNVICVATRGCDAVLMSPYATLPGDLPLAALGALAYFAVFSLATLTAFGYARTLKLLRILVGVMFAFTLRLLYLQAFVIEAYCSYCLLSAAVTATLLSIQIVRWLRA